MRYKMFGKIKLQYLKALERAPHGTLAFRSYLLMIQGQEACTFAQEEGEAGEGEEGADERAVDGEEKN
jgi:hypothetical protein